MVSWEPEGRYCCTKSMVTAPFWFSTEHCWTVTNAFLTLSWRCYNLQSTELKSTVRDEWACCTEDKHVSADSLSPSHTLFCQVWTRLGVSSKCQIVRFELVSICFGETVIWEEDNNVRFYTAHNTFKLRLFALALMQPLPVLRALVE